MKFYKRSVITRGDNEPYLVRYSLFSCRWFAVKIHHILISDDDCYHDHPWSFITLLLKGSYMEESYRPIKTGFGTPWQPRTDNIYDVATGERTENIQATYKAGSLLYRPAKFIHRLNIIKPVWSFVITFKKQRMWGFFSNKGWMPFWKYDHNRDGC